MNSRSQEEAVVIEQHETWNEHEALELQFQEIQEEVKCRLR